MRHSRPSTDEGPATDRAYVLSLTAPQLARLIGGDALSRDSRGREGAQGPGPGHSHEDRSMLVRIDPTSPDGFAVYTFSPRDDWRSCKDYVREKLVLAALSPGMYRRPHPPNSITKKSGPTGQSASNLRARWLWEGSLPAAGTPVEPYLASRAIVATGAVHYLPAKPPQHPHPAMIVPFAVPEEPEPGRLVIRPAAITAVHLTLLRADGSGKAACRANKKRIGRGAGVPMVIAPANDGLGLVTAEGVEDALSLHQATGLGAWAAGGAAFMPALAGAVPNYIEAVTIASHPEPEARRLAEELAVKLVRRGIAAEIQLIDQSHAHVAAAA
jgi:Toprim domain-containing protein